MSSLDLGISAPEEFDGGDWVVATDQPLGRITLVAAALSIESNGQVIHPGEESALLQSLAPCGEAGGRIRGVAADVMLTAVMRFGIRRKLTEKILAKGF